MKRQEVGLGVNDPSTITFYSHQRNFEEVVAIAEGREPSTSARKARQSVKVSNAIYQRAQRTTGRRLFSRRNHDIS